jgi:hypothetical protein
MSPLCALFSTADLPTELKRPTSSSLSDHRRHTDEDPPSVIDQVFKVYTPSVRWHSIVKARGGFSSQPYRARAPPMLSFLEFS